jgi:hypothetical protein
MIPTAKQLRKKIKKLKVKVEKKPYFSLVQEYIELEKKFLRPWLELFPLCVEMILYPLYILYLFIQGDFSPLSMLSLIKTYETWMEYFEYRRLKVELHSYITIVKKVGGPWISTNDSTYHWYVYADAMERLVACQKTG